MKKKQIQNQNEANRNNLKATERLFPNQRESRSRENTYY